MIILLIFIPDASPLGWQLKLLQLLAIGEAVCFFDDHCVIDFGRCIDVVNHALAFEHYFSGFGVFGRREAWK